MQALCVARFDHLRTRNKRDAPKCGAGWCIGAVAGGKPGICQKNLRYLGAFMGGKTRKKHPISISLLAKN